MKRIVLILIVIFTTVRYSSGQSQKITLSPDDIKGFKSRTLVVELLEEDPTQVKRFSKKSNSDDLENYQMLISKYNEYIQAAITKHWTLTPKVEFKNTTEIKSLISKRDPKLLILRCDRYGGGPYYGDRRSLNIHKGEKLLHGYLFFLPIEFGFDKISTLRQYNVSVIVQFIQKHMEAIVDANNSKLEVKDYIKQEADKMCGKLKEKQLLIPKHTYVKMDSNTLKNDIGSKFSLVSDDDAQKAYEETNTDYVFPVTFYLGNTERTNLSQIIIGMDGTPYSIKGPSVGQASRFVFDANDLVKLYKCD